MSRLPVCFLGRLVITAVVIYLCDITNVSLSEQAFQAIRQMIVTLELAPGAVVRDDLLQQQLGLGRTPIREALQRLVRDQFVTIIPRRGMYVSNIDVSELSTLYETRAILEPYVMRLACARGRACRLGRDGRRAGARRAPTARRRSCWRSIASAARSCGRRQATASSPTRSTCSTPRATGCGISTSPTSPPSITSSTSTAPSTPRWSTGDGDRAAALIESHMRAFNDKIGDAVRRRLESPLAGF